MSIDSSLTLPSGLVLSNRLVKSAMTEALANEDGLPSERLLTLYARWAKSGAGLLITGNVGIDHDHPVRPRDVVLQRGVDLAPFRRWAEVAKSGGARLVMQLNHAGRQTARVVNPRPMGPSASGAVKILGQFGPPREATEAELLQVIQRTGEAAALAEEAGFEGVQIHAAHGYLLNQFLSPDLNHRTDAWGGALPARARLLLECVRAARAATGPRFSVFVKLNSGDFLKGGFEEDDALRVVELLEHERIDALEISGGRYESGASFGYSVPGSAEREAYFLGFARRARQAIRAPLLLTGGLRTRATMDAALAEGALDLVGLARPMALFPDYPQRLLSGEPLPSVAPRRLGIRSLESAAELAWYYDQLQRLGSGRETDLAASPLASLMRYVTGDALDGFRHRRRQMRQ